MTLCLPFVLLLFEEHLLLRRRWTNYQLFSTLFCDFLTENEDYDLNRSSMSRWCNGRKAVNPRIVQYYTRPGYDLVLATTIEEQFAPCMTDICGMADQLHLIICNDRQISLAMKSILCRGYVSGEIGASAELIARVLIYAMQQPVEETHWTMRAS